MTMEQFEELAKWLEEHGIEYELTLLSIYLGYASYRVELPPVEED